MNLAELVTAHDGDGRAIYDAGGWHTWDDIRSAAAATAGALAGAGVGAGDRVVIAWPASAGFVSTYLGVLGAGAVAVPLNPSDPPSALATELTAVSPALVLAAEGSGSALRAAAERSGDPRVLVDDGTDGGWSGALAVASAAPFTPHQVGPGDPAVLLFTSGTAGPPKPALLTHGNLLANLRQLQSIAAVAAAPEDVGLATLPLFHIFGLNVALGLCLATGAPLAVLDRFVAEEAARLVEELSVTVVVGAPTTFAHWVQVTAGRSANGSAAPSLGTLRLAVAGGAPVPIELAKAFEVHVGVPLHQGYGLTEASPGVTTTIGEIRPRPGSAGRALPGVEIRLVDESGADALQGDPGEIWVRGPNVFAGYWGDEDATTAVLDRQGWLHTGDIGVAGADGELAVVDRRKDLIIVSGFNVHPGEVERVVAGAPGVADVVVVGLADPLSGEVVQAVVVPADPAAPPDEAAVIAYCASRLPRYKCPVAVSVVDRLPRGIGGEALRRQVRAGELPTGG